MRKWKFILIAGISLLFICIILLRLYLFSFQTTNNISNDTPKFSNAVGVPSANKYVASSNDKYIGAYATFITNALAAMAILIAVLTIAVAVVCGAGWSAVKKAMEERESIINMRKLYEEEQKKLRDVLQEDYGKYMKELERATFGLVEVQNAKTQLRNLLKSEDATTANIYKELEKTVPYPDIDCLRIYAMVLSKYENDINLVRLIRNGLQYYARNPKV